MSDANLAAIERKRRQTGPAPEETEIIDRCRRGDRAAFDELIRLYEKRVYNYAFRLCGNYDEANDVASETFLRIFHSLASFRGDAAFITWLFRVVTNVYLDERKRQRSRPQQSLEEMLELEETAVSRQFVDTGPTPEDRLETRERDEMLQRAIQALPDYQRMMIVMYHSEGQTYEEIASALDLPIGTVKSRLNRARLSLRELLAGHEEHFHL